MTNCLVYSSQNYLVLLASTNVEFWQFNPFSLFALTSLLVLLAFLVVVGR